MQNVYYNEVEAAYMRRRVQDAAAASGRAAQATASRPPRRARVPNLGVVLLRAREVLRQRQPVLRAPLPEREGPAICLDPC